jgi:hypothetical protein
MKRTAFVILVLTALVVFGSGCSQLNQENPLAPTLTALNASVAQTATAISLPAAQLDTLATAQVQATEQSQAIEVTQAAQVQEATQEQQATADVSGPILAELPNYGLDASSGQVGWLHDPLTLELSAYHDYKYGNDHMNVTAADFVFASDITWDTQYGGSGCGLMFRSNGDKAKPDQYMVMLTRFANGHAAFFATADGELANFHDYYPRTDDKSFSADNTTTNRLVVVARGNNIDIYTNGVKIATVDTTKPPKMPKLPAAPKIPAIKTDLTAMQNFESLKKEYDEVTGQVQANYNMALKNYRERQAVFTDGFMAMVALSESGDTRCTFDNTWLWLLNP